jgi:hypothetical protein
LRDSTARRDSSCSSRGSRLITNPAYHGSPASGRDPLQRTLAPEAFRQFQYPTSPLSVLPHVGKNAAEATAKLVPLQRKTEAEEARKAAKKAAATAKAEARAKKKGKRKKPKK